jgi:hypothetical protein
MRRCCPNPVRKSWIWWSSEMAGSRQDMVMKRVQKSSTNPSHRTRVSSPMGLSVSDGPI